MDNPAGASKAARQGAVPGHGSFEQLLAYALQDLEDEVATLHSKCLADLLSENSVLRARAQAPLLRAPQQHAPTPVLDVWRAPLDTAKDDGVWDVNRNKLTFQKRLGGRSEPASSQHSLGEHSQAVSSLEPIAVPEPIVDDLGGPTAGPPWGEPPRAHAEEPAASALCAAVDLPELSAAAPPQEEPPPDLPPSEPSICSRPPSTLGARRPSESSKDKASFSWKNACTQSMEAEEEERRRNAEELDVISSEEDTDGQSHTNRWRAQLQTVVRSSWFELFFAVAIITNSIFIGVEVDHMVTHPDLTEQPLFFEVVGIVYSSLFCGELCIRIAADGTFFFCSPQWGWNYLDLTTVIISIFETSLALARHWASDTEESSSSSSANVDSVRIMRVIRVTRIIRVVRVTRIVRFVRALRTLVHSIACTLKALVWAMILLMMIIYVFGILFTQGASVQLIDEDMDPEMRALVWRYWGTLPRSMFTLFKSISNGVDWDMVVHPLSWYWVILFILYMALTYFAVLNVVTGVFCQSAIESAQRDQDMVIQGQLFAKQTYIQRTKTLFSEIDHDGSGTITIRELERHLADPEIRQLFESLEIDTEDAWTLFKLLDKDGSNVIDSDEFVSGMQRLKGTATAVELARLSYEHKWLGRKVLDILEAVNVAPQDENDPESGPMKARLKRISLGPLA